jgi:hypothetical protein
MNRTRGRADGGSNVRVVLGEAAESGSLRGILDRAGFDVVGQASTSRDLLRLLTVIEPDVIVLDAEVSATVALSARDLAPLAGIVVVWPSAVSSSVADRQVDPARAAFDLPAAVRRAKRPQEARVAILAPVPALRESAQVVHLPAPKRGPWRLREHTFGLVAASFIIAVAALGLLRTTVVEDGVTRGSPIGGPTVGPSTSPGDGGAENQPQEPTNVRPDEPEPLGNVLLLGNVVPAPQAEGPVVDEPTNPPPGGGGGDGDGGGGGKDDGPDGVTDTGHHGGDFNGYDNPRVHTTPSRPAPQSEDEEPCDWQRHGGLGHAVHGVDQKPGR